MSLLSAPVGRSVPALARRPRGPGALAWLVGLLALVALASLMWGARDVSPGVVLDALLRPEPGDPDHLVVRDLRVPRTVIGLVGGAALGAAGALMQVVTRNPIADPGLLGLNAGASLALVGAAVTATCSSLITDLGFTLAPSVGELDTEESTFYYTISTEEVDKLTSDVLLSYVPSEERAEEIEREPVAEAMSQFREDRVATVAGEDVVSSVSPPTALSLTWGLDTFVDALAEAVPD